MSATTTTMSAAAAVHTATAMHSAATVRHTTHSTMHAATVRHTTSMACKSMAIGCVGHEMTIGRMRHKAIMTTVYSEVIAVEVIGMVKPMIKSMVETVIKPVMKIIIMVMEMIMVMEIIVREPAPSKTRGIPPKAGTKPTPWPCTPTTPISRLPAPTIVREIIPIPVRSKLTIGIHIGLLINSPIIQLGVIRLRLCIGLRLRWISCCGRQLIARNGPGRQGCAGRLTQSPVMIQHLGDQSPGNPELLQMDDIIRRQIKHCRRIVNIRLHHIGRDTGRNQFYHLIGLIR